jgi:hypothetical protein
MLRVNNKKLTAQTRRLNEAPNEDLLVKFRSLEKKMGLVLTLVCVLAVVRWFRLLTLLPTSLKPLCGVLSTSSQLQNLRMSQKDGRNMYENDVGELGCRQHVILRATTHRRRTDCYMLFRFHNGICLLGWIMAELLELHCKV